MKIFTKWLTSTKSSWVEIGLVEHMLVTEHFHFIYTLCLWPEIRKKKKVSQIQSAGNREEGSGEEKPSALHAWVSALGREAASQAAAWHQRAHLTLGGGGEPRTYAQVDTCALY